MPLPFMRYLFALIFICCLCTAKAQSCFNVAAGNDTTISCAQNCLNLKAKVPDVRTTDDYQVVRIPYQPFPYINAAGVEFNPLYLDDNYSGPVTLPFTFCFYGVNYNTCVVGTNGIITFDVATNANTYNAYVLDNQIPYAGGVPNDGSISYYPRASIMGPYHDIDPDNATTSPQPRNRKMEYIITGTAPCRKFILNFNEMPYYFCASNIVTQQMVLYEGTGIIDIFIASKPIACAASTNESQAILGIQNWDRDKAVAVAGRNNTVWQATNEGWRFIPSGGGSLFKRVELYKSGVFVATGVTTPLGNGELDVAFNNICQTEAAADYEVRAFYEKCDNAAVETEGSDTIRVTKEALTVTSAVTNPLCNGNTGTITITPPVRANVEYSIDGGSTWQTSNIFVRPAGSYTIIVRGIGNTCSTTVNAAITQPAALTSSATGTTATCAGNDGIISINAIGGSPAYRYSVNNGSTWQTANTFTVLPGNYNNILVQDVNGCTTNTNATVGFTDNMFLTLGNNITVCQDASVTLQPQTNAQTNSFVWLPATYLSSTNIKNPVSTPADTIQYTLTAQWGICQRTQNITIQVLKKPVVNAGADTLICDKATAILRGAATNLSGTVNYLWSPAARVTNANTSVTTTTANTTQLYTLTVTDNYGCNFKVTDDVLVTMRPPVVAFAGNDTVAVYGVPHQLFGSGGSSYLWSPANNLNNPALQNPLATLFNNTRFTVLVKNDIGCSNTDDVFVKVYKGPTYYVPNAFSPNNDGLNDIFRVTPVGITSTAYFMVYNRYGELVFKTDKPQQGWNGTYRGKQAIAGSYVWMIKGTDYTGKIIEMKGSVLLIK